MRPQCAINNTPDWLRRLPRCQSSSGAANRWVYRFPFLPQCTPAGALRLSSSRVSDPVLRHRAGHGRLAGPVGALPFLALGRRSGAAWVSFNLHTVRRLLGRYLRRGCYSAQQRAVVMYYDIEEAAPEASWKTRKPHSRRQPPTPGRAHPSKHLCRRDPELQALSL